MTPARLNGLADRCEVATGPSLVLERDIALSLYPQAEPIGVDARISVWDGNGRTQLTVKRYTASEDVAATLEPEGSNTALAMQDRHSRRWRWELRLADARRVSAWGSTAALARTAASLRARAMEGE